MLEVVARRDPAAGRRILVALPEWFGDPEAVDAYVADAADERFVSLLATEGGRTAGLLLLHERYPEAAEVHLLAVEPQRHRAGIGRALVEEAAARSEEAGRRLLSVHTVGPSLKDPYYARTRDFYRAVGFLPLEEHSGLDFWGPMQILVRPLGGAVR